MSFRLNYDDLMLVNVSQGIIICTNRLGALPLDGMLVHRKLSSQLPLVTIHTPNFTRERHLEWPYPA